MQLRALAVNTLWGLSNGPSYWRFRRAVRNPHAAQAAKLREILARNASTAFGKAHGFDRIRDYKDFARRVPLADYEDLEPWITRIREGEANVLTWEPVTHLVPTSGSTGGCKLIPFTTGLQREFNAAVGPWLLDLQRRIPGVSGGPAYWSITPAFAVAGDEKSAVRIGFDSDTSYLGGARRFLAEAVMAVPSQVQRTKTLEEFRFQTLLHLLRCDELRLISVWHPSFLTLLFDDLPRNWPELLGEIAPERSNTPRRLLRRAEELRKADPLLPRTLWPNLCAISCWGDGNAELAIANLQKRLPKTFIQRKGLLATEAVVSIPFGAAHILAVTSHFFELLDGAGRVHLAHELKEGEEYEVVVTTGGGLYRYRLHDRVVVTGFFKRAPELRFLGRAGNVSDFCGEKLSEAFVGNVVQKLIEGLSTLPRFALVAPDESRLGLRYTLYLEGKAEAEITTRLDALLSENPHYALCRDLGQLQPPSLFLITKGGYETFASREISGGKRLGDIKPWPLSTCASWSKLFNGDYLPPDMKRHASVLANK
jgi:hypothetical protein